MTPSTTSTESADARNVVWRWQQRAAQWLDFPLGRFLDFGCGVGGLIDRVGSRCTECHGVDVNEAVLRQVRSRLPDHSFHLIDATGRTPYPDNHFDTVALVDVIEHVADERNTLAEISRVLVPGGTLILTTPHRGLLTFLDLGNFKFLFPRFHRFIHLRILRKRDYYERRFVQTKETGLIGDISVSSNRPAWHRHYRPEEIVASCPPELALQEHAVYFPAMRAFMLCQTALRVLTVGLISRMPWPLSALQRRLSRIESRTGDQLVMRFTKQRRAS